MAAKETIYEALIAIRADNAQLKTDLSKAQSTLNSSLLSMQGLASKLAPIISIGGIAGHPGQCAAAQLDLRRGVFVGGGPATRHLPRR